MLNYPFCLMNVRYSALIEQRQLEVSHQSSEEFLSPPPSSIEPQLNEPITRTTAVAVEGMFPSSIRGISESWGLCIWPGFAVTHGQRTYLMWRPPPSNPPVWQDQWASLCRLADSCLCWALTWRPGSECWPYAPIVNSSQMPSKQKPKTSKEFI